MPALFYLTGPSVGRRVDIEAELVIGRSPSCGISLDDAKVSRRHARIASDDSQVKVSDLGSRNGTLVNGDRTEGEVLLLPGDRLQIGDTTFLFEPGSKAEFIEGAMSDGSVALTIEEVLPVSGVEGGLFNSGLALMGATSEAMVLRRAADEALRGLTADRAVAVLGGPEGLQTAVTAGAATVQLPRAMVQAALGHRELTRWRGQLCVPLAASGGAAFGVLYAERSNAFGKDDERALASLGRLTGEALVAVRARWETDNRAVSMVGSARPFRKAVEQARRCATHSEPVTFWGESGSGRQTLAAYLHGKSSRALGPLVFLNGRKSPSQLLEEVTGRASAPGLPPSSSALLRADGGTLVLAHLESMNSMVQERLVDLISRKVAPSRLGGDEPVDIRIIATASKSPSELRADGHLIPALSKLLERHAFEVPPLRDRRPDVLPLLEQFTAHTARLHRRDSVQFSTEAKRILTEFHWPGNVSELKLVAEHLALSKGGEHVSALDLPPLVRRSQERGEPSLAARVAQVERDAIQEVLRGVGGKKIRAAEVLGISRPTLDKKLEEYQIQVEKHRG